MLHDRTDNKGRLGQKHSLCSKRFHMAFSQVTFSMHETWGERKKVKEGGGRDSFPRLPSRSFHQCCACPNFRAAKKGNLKRAGKSLRKRLLRRLTKTKLPNLIFFFALFRTHHKFLACERRSKLYCRHVSCVMRAQMMPH